MRSGRLDSPPNLAADPARSTLPRRRHCSHDLPASASREGEPEAELRASAIQPDEVARPRGTRSKRAEWWSQYMSGEMLVDGAAATVRCELQLLGQGGSLTRGVQRYEREQESTVSGHCPGRAVYCCRARRRGLCVGRPRIVAGPSLIGADPQGTSVGAHYRSAPSTSDKGRSKPEAVWRLVAGWRCPGPVAATSRAYDQLGGTGLHRPLGQDLGAWSAAESSARRARPRRQWTRRGVL